MARSRMILLTLLLTVLFWQCSAAFCSKGYASGQGENPTIGPVYMMEDDFLVHDPAILRLKNGLRVVLVPADFSGYLVMAQVGSGFLDEAVSSPRNDAGAGVAHSVEHMLFRGSKAFPDFEATLREYETVGEDFNGFTDLDSTRYIASASGGKLFQALRLLGSQLSSPLFKSSDWATESKALEAELNAILRVPSTILEHESLGAFFKSPRIGNGLFASPGQIRRQTLDQLQSFYKEHYVASNMDVVILGDVGRYSFAEYRQILEDAFGGLQAGPVPRKGTLYGTSSKSIDEGILTLRPGVQPMVTLSFQMGSSLSDYWSVTLLRKLLQRRLLDGRLERCKTEGWLHGFDMTTFSAREQMVLQVRFDLTSKGQENWDSVVAAFRQDLSSLAKRGMSQEAFQLLRDQMKREYFRDGIQAYRMHLSAELLKYRGDDFGALHHPYTELEGMSSKKFQNWIESLLSDSLRISMMSSTPPKGVHLGPTENGVFGPVLPFSLTNLREKINGSHLGDLSLMSSDPISPSELGLKISTEAEVRVPGVVLSFDRREGTGTGLLLRVSSFPMATDKQRTLMKSWLGMLPFLPSMQMIVQRYEDRGIHVDYEPLREGIGFVLRVVSMPFRGEQSLHSIIEVSRAIHELNAAIFDGDLKEREFQIARERANARARHDFVEHSLLSYALSTFSGRGDPLTDLSTEQIDLNATTLEDVRNFRKLFKREKSVKGVLQGAWPDAEVASLSGALSGLVNVSHLLPAPDLGSRGVAQRPEISDQVSSRVLIRRIGLPYLPHSKEHWYAKILAQILYQRMRWILRGESGLAYHYHASVEVSEEKQIYLQLGVESPGKLSSLASGLTAVVEQLASTDPTQEEIAFAKKRVLREFYSVTQSLEGQFWAAFEGFSYQTVRMDLELLSPREFLIFLRRALPPLDSGSLDGDQGRRSLSLLIEENPSHDAVCQVYLENQHQK